jgi:hypothetical protein
MNSHLEKETPMANMSYCRFQNTSNDLEDCADALEELANDPSARPLSEEELAAARRLVRSCRAILELVAGEAAEVCEITDELIEENLEMIAGGDR